MVFALWTATILAVLVRLRRDTVARTGQSFPGPAAALESLGGFFRRPGYGPARRRLAVLTLLLCIAIWLGLP